MSDEEALLRFEIDFLRDEVEGRLQRVEEYIDYMALKFDSGDPVNLLLEAEWEAAVVAWMGKRGELAVVERKLDHLLEAQGG